MARTHKATKTYMKHKATKAHKKHKAAKAHKKHKMTRKRTGGTWERALAKLVVPGTLLAANTLYKHPHLRKDLRVARKKVGLSKKKRSRSRSRSRS